MDLNDGLLTSLVTVMHILFFFFFYRVGRQDIRFRYTKKAE